MLILFIFSKQQFINGRDKSIKQTFKHIAFAKIVPWVNYSPQMLKIQRLLEATDLIGSGKHIFQGLFNLTLDIMPS
jgi:hypothetical protein